MIREPKFRLPRKGRIHAIDNTHRNFCIQDEIICKQRVIEKGTRKRLFLQKIRFEDNGQIQYRFTYYMLGVKPGAKGSWVFGQYSLLIPVKQLKFFLGEARKRKWEGF